MYTMKEVCQIVGWSYETLKYYCKEGLIPNVKRDKNNYRVFDENNIEWIKGLQCLKKCGMSLKDMRMYLDYCMQGPVYIPERVDMLNETKDMRDRILFEKIPSSQKWLPVIVNAMRDGKVIEMTYQSFWRDEPNTYTAKPYCLKLFKQRWLYQTRKVDTKIFLVNTYLPK